ncbi:RNA polymerase sigma factor (sigma-70 family) [Pseudomonas nitritireducens]|uniref:RNA polymerase sigma factor (Sigma-70 family) n=1 Tax=Pseudomonas nitroreducens TaxID=46680 RepID=A0A7W7KQR1_PSENT|nr:sigma-70 family RNA polymerase sigma factor [Pseudomonas nitritireducens]MBB4866820.1 RNA polymerase sigma factor (sigma-70 family) [Pseudomonas nitritireducens]
MATIAQQPITLQALKCAGALLGYPSFAEVAELVAKYQQTGCGKSLERILLAHSGLCHEVAKRFRYRLNQEDTFQECMEELIHCAREFKFTGAYPFFAYAKVRLMHKSGRRCIVNWGLVSVPEHSKPFHAAFRRLLKCGVGPDIRQSQVEAIASELGVSEAHVKYAHSAMHDNYLEHDSEALEAEDHEGLQSGDVEAEILRDEHARITGELISNISNILDEKSASIITMRYLQDGEKCPTNKEIGIELGISAERVRQLDVRSQQKLREAVHDHGIITKREFNRRRAQRQGRALYADGVQELWVA